MNTIEMIKNLAQRNTVVSSTDVLVVFTELENARKESVYFCNLNAQKNERIGELEQELDKAEHRAGCMAARAFDYDCHRQRLEEAARKVIKWCRQEAEDRTGNAENAEFYSCVKELRAALAFVESTR